ncbi:MAG: glycosyltransferase family 39 protein [Myxococcota bacterium]
MSPAAATSGRFTTLTQDMRVLFVVAVVIRVAVILALRNFDQVTGFEHEDIALHLVAGHGYAWERFGPLSPTACQYPFYTFYLAAFFWLFGKNFLYVELSHALISAGSVLLLRTLAREFVPPRAALLAAWLWAVHPISVYWSARPQPLTVDIFLLMLLMLLMARAMRDPALRPWVLSGILLGACALSKTTYVFLMAPLGLWSWLNRTVDARTWLTRFAQMVVVFALTLVPWITRNAITLGGFVPLTTCGTHVLWVATHPEAEGGVFAADGRPIPEKLTPEMEQRLWNASGDIERQQIFLDEAMKNIRANPGRIVELIPKRLVALWWFEPYMPSEYPLARKVVWVLELIPTLLGLWLLRRQWRQLSAFVGIYVTLSVLYGAFHGSPRFRYFVEFTFVILAAHALLTLWDLLRNRGGKRPAP